MQPIISDADTDFGSVSKVMLTGCYAVHRGDASLNGTPFPRWMSEDLPPFKGFWFLDLRCLKMRQENALKKSFDYGAKSNCHVRFVGQGLHHDQNDGTSDPSPPSLRETNTLMMLFTPTWALEVTRQLLMSDRMLHPLKSEFFPAMTVKFHWCSTPVVVSNFNPIRHLLLPRMVTAGLASTRPPPRSEDTLDVVMDPRALTPAPTTRRRMASPKKVDPLPRLPRPPGNSVMDGMGPLPVGIVNPFGRENRYVIGVRGSTYAGASGPGQAFRRGPRRTGSGLTRQDRQQRRPPVPTPRFGESRPIRGFTNGFRTRPYPWI